LIGPAQESLDAGHQLGHLEGLGEIIVGPEVEALHLVAGAGTRCQHQHRNLIARRPSCLQPIAAIAIRQSQIENDRIELAGAERRRGILEPGYAIDRKASMIQAIAHKFGHAVVIFHEQQTHEQSLWQIGRRRRPAGSDP
jgi:hypothetical protein